MPGEKNIGVYVCKGLKIDKDELWEMLKAI